MQDISYRPLRESDLPTMADWLNRAHLRSFYQREPISLPEVVAKYGARVRQEVPTHCSLAILGERPFGYLQCYRVADWPDWRDTIDVDWGISIDLFIGEPLMLGQGIGRRMLSGYVEEVVFPLYPDERLCWIGHEVENAAALACSSAAGFSPVRKYVEEERPCLLLVRQRTRPDALPPRV